jgi:hypothetical protein
MRTTEEIQRKILDLHMSAHWPESTKDPVLAARCRDQLHALKWVLGEHDDDALDWVAYALAKLGPQARELFPALTANEADGIILLDEADP